MDMKEQKLSDIQISGLAKMHGLDEKIANKIGNSIHLAQTGDAAALTEARAMLINEAKFTEDELGMFAVFGGEQ